jgi:hypothetical protein
VGCFRTPPLYNRFVYIRTGFINTTEVEKAVDEFLKTLGPEVVRVRYNIGEDWMGDPALHFRIVLADSSVDLKSLDKVGKVTGQIRRPFFEKLQSLGNWGLFPYINFRTESEQAQLNDPKWA